jgi:tetratricopeptide (TPR) repeat protein
VLDGGSDGLDYLKKAFENNPSDCRSCLALGEFYANRNMFIEEEKCLTKYINMCPYNPKAYSLLVSAYRQKRRFADAERLLTGLLDSGIHSSSAYYELGLTYLDQGKYKDAKKVFKSIIKNDPNSPQVYADLFNTYAYQGKTDEAESFFLSLYAKDKNNIFLLNVLGWLYRSNRDFAKAERYLSESLKLNPHNGGTIFELAKLFIEEKKYSDAERLLKKGIIQGPDFLGYYIELGRVYFIQNKTLQAKELMRLALERFPGNDLVGGLLSVISLKDEAPADYKNYVEMVINMRLKYYNSVTKTNYLKLKRTLDENKIQLVAVQYPMRSILPLKKMLEGENGIIFVDNENLFKNAVKKEGYNEFFLDCFGGDFGHCTKKGNRLLANNIANTIKKELVRK